MHRQTKATAIQAAVKARAASGTVPVGRYPPVSSAELLEALTVTRLGAVKEAVGTLSVTL